MTNKDEILQKKLPEHIAIIMDGSGRWASKRLLGKKAGHKKGAKTLENITDFANKIDIKHLTVYAFSTENWKRPKEEISGIMDLIRDYLDRYLKRPEDDNIKINVIGDISKLDNDIQQKIIKLTEKTYNKTGLNLHIALNYGGRDDIIRAINNYIKNANNSELTEKTFSALLDTKNINDPDIIIRTGGEYRLSNFLTWQTAYSELYFCDVLWPDFTKDDLLIAISEYQSRERRFGGRKE